MSDNKFQIRLKKAVTVREVEYPEGNKIAEGTVVGNFPASDLGKLIQREDVVISAPDEKESDSGSEKTSGGGSATGGGSGSGEGTPPYGGSNESGSKSGKGKGRGSGK